MTNLQLKATINYKMKNEKHLRENLIELRKIMGLNFYDFVKSLGRMG